MSLTVMALALTRPMIVAPAMTASLIPHPRPFSLKAKGVEALSRRGGLGVRESTDHDSLAARQRHCNYGA
jgi:hypothetical protein